MTNLKAKRSTVLLRVRTYDGASISKYIYIYACKQRAVRAPRARGARDEDKYMLWMGDGRTNGAVADMYMLCYERLLNVMNDEVVVVDACACAGVGRFAGEVR